MSDEYGACPFCGELIASGCFVLSSEIEISTLCNGYAHEKCLKDIEDSIIHERDKLKGLTHEITK